MRGVFRHLHFVGIGGIGMCGLAELLHNQGLHITGSDIHDGPTITRLRKLGIKIVLGHKANNIGEAELLVVSSAVKRTNPEVKRAKDRSISIYSRADLLAEIMSTKQGVAVTGTHGKTTTTSLVAHILESGGLDPTVIIGGRMLGSSGDPTGARSGSGEVFVAEADESDGSFLKLSPLIGVVTNIESEHLDHYGSYTAVKEAFLNFSNQISTDGLCVLCGDHPGVQSILPHIVSRTSTYGFSHRSDLMGTEIEVNKSGMRFVVYRHGKLLGSVNLPLLGHHNVLNALAAITVALELGMTFPIATDALATFRGIERRFETKGNVGEVRVVDDYAHHPTEIRATLAAARGSHGGRIVAVFQPHRYTRTRDLFDDFITAFQEADILCITDIYGAGEKPIADITGLSLAEAVQQNGHPLVEFVADLKDIPTVLLPKLKAGDLVMTLGAGSVTTVGAHLLEYLREEQLC